MRFLVRIDGNKIGREFMAGKNMSDAQFDTF